MLEGNMREYEALRGDNPVRTEAAEMCKSCGTNRRAAADSSTLQLSTYCYLHFIREYNARITFQLNYFLKQGRETFLNLDGTLIFYIFDIFWFVDIALVRINISS